MAFGSDVRRPGGHRWRALGALLGFAGCLLPGLPRVSARGRHVLELEEGYFDATIAKHPLILVMFYAPWDGNCKQMLPEFEVAAEALEGRMVLAKIDATIETKLAERFKLDSYPSLHFFKDGMATKYTGGRTSAGILDWVKANMGRPFKVLKSDADVAEAMQKRGRKTIIIFEGDSKAEKATFFKLADGNRTLGSFYYRASVDTAVTTPPALRLYRGLGRVGEEVTFEGDLQNSTEALEFLVSEMLPRWGEVTAANYEGYLPKTHKGMFWGCFDPARFHEDAEKFAGVFQEVANVYTQFPFVYADTKEHKEHIKDALGCTEFPTIVLQLGDIPNDEEKTFNLHVKENALTAGAVTSFIEDVLAGKMKEFVYQSPGPEGDKDDYSVPSAPYVDPDDDFDL